MKVSATNLQNSFGKYLQLVLEGTEIIITKNGHALAELKKLSDDIIKEEQANYHSNKKMSYTKFLAMTENNDQRYELIDNEVFLLSSPSYEHQVISADLLIELSSYFKDKSCKVLAAPLDITLSRSNNPTSKNVVSPDLMIICDSDNVKKGKYCGTPDLLLEILSPSTRSKDMVRKLDLYMESGIKEYWTVDLKYQQINIYYFIDNELEQMMTYRKNETLHSRLYPDLKIHLNSIFRSD